MKLVYVEWRDAVGAGHEWSELDRLTQERRTTVIRSVGWCLADTDEEIVLVPHVSFEKSDSVEPQGCGDMAIPKAAIVVQCELKPPVVNAVRKVLKAHHTSKKAKTQRGRDLTVRG